jgi:hypothetical protein
MSTNFDDYLINHVVFALDASSSMSGRRARQLVEIAGAEVAHLAKVSASDEMNQETRVAFYTFNGKASCIVPERDVMRLPTIKEVYHVGGSTALLDAVTLVLDDFELVSQKYGNHAFLLYVLTDGEENVSSPANRMNIGRRLANLPENVTIACFVPDEDGKRYLSGFGFPAGNTAIWDVDAADGMKQVGQVMRQATTNYMTARASGLSSTTSLFSMDATAVNDTTVKQNLTPLSTDEYVLIPVTPPPASNEGKPWEIKQFAEHCGHQYTAGYSGYYELVATKKKPSEVIQGNKKIIVVDKKTNQAYGGNAGRSLVGLGAETKRVRPGDNPDYKIYVLSGSVNRHLVPGTHLLIKK